MTETANDQKPLSGKECRRLGREYYRFRSDLGWEPDFEQVRLLCRCCDIALDAGVMLRVGLANGQE